MGQMLDYTSSDVGGKKATQKREEEIMRTGATDELGQVNLSVNRKGKVV
jgi:hypothetical protein